MRSLPHEPGGSADGFFPRLYDLFLAPAERAGLGELRAWLTAPTRGDVLEIGAGTGRNFPHYEPGVRVIAVDPDFAMLGRARNRATAARARIMLVAADGQALPFRGEVFDAAVVGLAMCTSPHPERALEETRRTLRRGGEARLLEHVRVDTPVVGRLQDWLTPVWRHLAGGCHLNRNTVDTVAQSGFVLEEVHRHAGGHIVGIVAVASATSDRGHSTAESRARSQVVTPGFLSTTRREPDAAAGHASGE